MIHCNRNSLLALLLSTLLVVVQTALPWMHVGCQHNPSKAASTESAHRHCHHHRHVETPAVDSAVIDGHGHDQSLSDDCAACRFSLLSSARCEPTTPSLIQHVALLDASPSVAGEHRQLVGLYRSRAPPALS